MRITIEAEDENAAIWAMVFAKEFITQKKEDDETSNTWGFFHCGYGGQVTKKKNGNVSVNCRRNKGDSA